MNSATKSGSVQNARFAEALYEIEQWGEVMRNSEGFRQWHGAVKGESFCAVVYVWHGASVIRFCSLDECTGELVFNGFKSGKALYLPAMKSRRVLIEPDGRMVLECDGSPVYTENKYFKAARALCAAIQDAERVEMPMRIRSEAAESRIRSAA